MICTELHVSCVNHVLHKMARDASKLALPGLRHSVEWWGLPTRLEWALASIGVLWVTKMGPWQHAWPLGVCVGLGCRS